MTFVGVGKNKTNANIFYTTNVKKSNAFLLLQQNKQKNVGTKVNLDLASLCQADFL